MCVSCYTGKNKPVIARTGVNVKESIMAKAKKKVKRVYAKKSKRPAYQLKAEDIMKEKGVTPYNAAIMAGAKHQQAELFAGLERYRALTQMKYSDIAEIHGGSVVQIIKNLIQRSGINDREEGAQLIKGTDDSFVEAPDDKAQLLYLKELIELCELKKNKDDRDAGEDKNRPFDIVIRVPPGTKKLDRDVEVIIKGNK